MSVFGPDPGARGARLAFAAIIALAAAVRLTGLGDSPHLGGNEGFALRAALLPLRDLVFPELFDHGTQIGFYLLAHFWVGLVSLLGRPDPFVLRLLPLILALATLPIIAAIAARLAARLPLSGAAVRAFPLVATALFALNPLAVQYAREFRSYSLELFLLALTSWIALRAFDTPVAPRRWWIAYGTLTALALYAHMLAGLFVAAQVGSLFLVAVITRRRALAIDLVWAAGLTLVLITPLIVTLLRIGPSPMNWILPLAPSRVLAALGRLVGAASEVVSPSIGNGPAAPEQGIAALLVAATPILVGTAVLLRHRRRVPDAVALVAVPLGVVPLALAALSVLVAPVWTTRYLYVLLLPISLAGAIGGLALLDAARRTVGRRLLGIAPLVLLLVLAATLIPLTTLLLDTLNDA